MNGHIWRLLEVGEVKCEGDEFYDVHYGWRAIESAIGQIGGVINNGHLPHRRRVPLWPAPRDARTDPPKESDCDASGCVLAFVNGVWMRVLRGNANSVAAAWLPLPPHPQPEAEKAWEVYCAVHGTPVSGFSKDMFIRGFNAGKSSK